MPYSRGNCRVLIVEDDPLSRGALAALLRHAGCTCCTARSVDEARLLLDGQTHIITDLVLNKSSGVDLLNLIRRLGLSYHVCVITALERDHDLVQAAAKFEPEIVLRKPLDVDALMSWLDHSRA